MSLRGSGVAEYHLEMGDVYEHCSSRNRICWIEFGSTSINLEVKTKVHCKGIELQPTYFLFCLGESPQSNTE